MDDLSNIQEAGQVQVQVCKELIDWCVQEKRIYLKQTLDAKLIALYLKHKMYTEGISLITELLRELKRIDDKNMLVEVHLLESHAFFDLKNIPKSKAALTAARTTANGIFCPPLLQASLDIQSGIIHAEEKDYRTAYSYFYEAFEGYSSQDDAKAVLSLKYMLLCKIMMNNASKILFVDSLYSKTQSIISFWINRLMIFITFCTQSRLLDLQDPRLKALKRLPKHIRIVCSRTLKVLL